MWQAYRLEHTRRHPPFSPAEMDLPAPITWALPVNQPGQSGPGPFGILKTPSPLRVFGKEQQMQLDEPDGDASGSN
jgi:hypothetical protein